MTEIRKGYKGGSGQKQPGLTEKKKGERVITENEQNSGTNRR